MTYESFGVSNFCKLSARARMSDSEFIESARDK